MAGEFQIGDVVATITADSSKFVEGFDQAQAKVATFSKQVDAAAAAVPNIEASLSRTGQAANALSASTGNLNAQIIETATQAPQLASSLAQGGAAADSLAASAGRLGRELTVVASNGVITADGIARIAQSAIQVGTALQQPADRALELVSVFTQLASSRPAATMAEIATEAEKLSATNPSAPLASIAAEAAKIAAVAPQRTIVEIAAEMQRLVSASAAAAPAVGTISQIGAALLRVAPAASVAITGVALFDAVLSTLTKDAEATSAAIDRIYTGKTTGQFADDIDKISRSTELASAGLSKLDQQIALTQEAISAKAAASPDFIAQGQVAAEQAAAAVKLLDDAYRQAEADSQSAAATLHDSFTSAIDGVTTGIDKMFAALKAADPAGEYERLQTLANELNFSGPLSQLQGLDKQIQDADARIRQFYADAEKKGQITFDTSQVNAELARVRALLEQNFKAKVVLEAQLDEQRAAAELSKIPSEKVITILTTLGPAGGGGPMTPADAAEYYRTNKAEADAQAQIAAEVANFRAPGGQLSTLAGGIGSLNLGGVSVPGGGQIPGAEAGTLQQYQASGEIKFSSDVQNVLDQAQTVIDSAPLSAPITFTPEIVMSPAVPFTTGIANMQAMINGLTGSSLQFTGGFGGSGISPADISYFKEKYGSGQYADVSSAFDLLLQGTSASTAAIQAAIAKLTTEQHDWQTAASQVLEHSFQVLIPTSAGPGGPGSYTYPTYEDRARATASVITKLEALLAAIQQQQAAQAATAARTELLQSRTAAASEATARSLVSGQSGAFISTLLLSANRIATGVRSA